MPMQFQSRVHQQETNLIKPVVKEWRLRRNDQTLSLSIHISCTALLKPLLHESVVVTDRYTWHGLVTADTAASRALYGSVLL
jgi:hypothetical protein